MLPGNKSSQKIRSVSVKTLVEFAAKSGSLDRRFTPSPSGQEGIEGHKYVTNNRPSDYKTEYSLDIEYLDLHLRGRADGYSASRHCIEEIKTFYGDVNKIPANHRDLHWAQAKCYGWMFCAQTQCNSINIAVIYFNLHTHQEYRYEQTWNAIDLQDYGATLVKKYQHWQAVLDQRQAHLANWIDQLPFPHAKMHHAQRQMAEAVYKAAATGRSLLAEAPTGTGKTLAALFPALKALIHTPVDKLFYLTAKTTGKHLALQTLRLIASDKDNAPLRSLELTAREKICLEPEKQCLGDACPYAFDFYGKLDAARQAAYQYSLLDKETLTELAYRFEICPFYLSTEMSRWVDIVVGDVNYFFDGTPLLLALTREFDWHPYVLIDESHNLIDRGRRMFSAELRRDQLLLAKKHAPTSLKKSLEQVNRQWLKLLRSTPEQSPAFAVVPQVPEALTLSLQEFSNSYIDFIQHNPDHPVQHSPVQEFFFSALAYQKIADIFGDDFCVDMQRPKPKAELLTLRNLIPARLIAARLQAAHCACFFSATLHPSNYYRSLLGLPDDTVDIKVTSPFQSDQLQVHIARGLSTRFNDRASAIAPMCALIKNQLLLQPGNALAFFPSYEYLQQLEAALRLALANTEIELIVQSRRMNETDRQLFVQQFSQKKNLLGLAVLGGIFGEGIDLTGDSLKGVFIATLGLPQVNPMNEHLRQIMQNKFGHGYDFTYTFPGIQKVVQAAGRVIRTPSDTGYLWLMDERFYDIKARGLLPRWWQFHH